MHPASERGGADENDLKNILHVTKFEQRPDFDPPLFHSTVKLPVTHTINLYIIPK